jgi:hypothetical protein
MKTFQEFMLVIEGLDMKTFKANRKKAKASAASADAKKRGHVGKEWYNSGRNILLMKQRVVVQTWMMKKEYKTS